MKKLFILVLIFTIFLSFTTYSQKPFTFNQGGATATDYLSVINYQMVKGKVIVQVSINNVKHNFILDTGAPTVITQQLFDELHPTVLTNIDITDQSGLKKSMPVVSLPSIEFGGITFTDTPTLVSQEPLIFDCFKVDGFIGSNLLRNSIIQFSGTDHTIILTDTSKKLALKKKYRSKMEVNAIQSSPYVWIELKNGKTEGREQLLFDSGMDDFYDLSLTAYNTFEKHTIFEVLSKAYGSFSMGLHGTAEDTEQYKFRLPEFILNGTVFKNPTIYTTNDRVSRIGSEIFKYGTTTLDYKDRLFYFEPNIDVNTDLAKKSMPFTPVLKDNKLIIGIIWNESLMAKINPGDEIIKFGNIDYQNMDICAIMTADKILGSDKKMTLIVKDKNDGRLKTIEIENE